MSALQARHRHTHTPTPTHTHTHLPYNFFLLLFPVFPSYSYFHCFPISLAWGSDEITLYSSNYSDMSPPFSSLLNLLFLYLLILISLTLSYQSSLAHLLLLGLLRYLHITKSYITHSLLTVALHINRISLLSLSNRQSITPCSS